VKGCVAAYIKVVNVNKKQTKKYQENMKLKDEINKARTEASTAMQFLVDIGSKKHRSKYKGSNKDIMSNKAEVINYFLKEITTAVLLRHVCKSKKKVFKEADKLMEELFK
jgi:hypothetical protein